MNEEKIVQEYVNGKSRYFLSKKYSIGDKKILKILKKNNIKIRGLEHNGSYMKNYTVDENFFKDINTEAKQYWLGFIQQDGFISGNKLGISLGMKDKKHLHRFQKDIKFTGKIHKYKQTFGFQKGTYYSKIIFSNKTIIEDLKKLGFSNNKTFDLNFDFSILKKELIHHFVRGFFDGDGSITYSIDKNKLKKQHKIPYRSKVSFIGTFKMMEKIDFLLSDKKHSIYKTRNQYTLDLGGNRQVLRIYSYLYKNQTIYLKRKKIKFEELKNMYM